MRTLGKSFFDHSQKLKFLQLMLIHTDPTAGCNSITHLTPMILVLQEINEKRRSVQDRLDELGEGVPLDTAERVQCMWTLVTDYCEMFKNTIRTLAS